MTASEQFDADERRRQRMSAHAPDEPSRDHLDAWLETWVRRDGVAWARSTRFQRAAVMDKWIAPLIDGGAYATSAARGCAIGERRCSTGGHQRHGQQRDADPVGGAWGGRRGRPAAGESVPGIKRRTRPRPPDR